MVLLYAVLFSVVYSVSASYDFLLTQDSDSESLSPYEVKLLQDFVRSDFFYLCMVNVMMFPPPEKNDTKPTTTTPKPTHRPTHKPGHGHGHKPGHGHGHKPGHGHIYEEEYEDERLRSYSGPEDEDGHGHGHGGEDGHGHGHGHGHDIETNFHQCAQHALQISAQNGLKPCYTTEAIDKTKKRLARTLDLALPSLQRYFTELLRR